MTNILIILTDDQERGDYNAPHDSIQPPPEWLEKVLGGKERLSKE